MISTSKKPALTLTRQPGRGAQFGHSEERRLLSWKRLDYGLTVEAELSEEFELGRVSQKGDITWAEVFIKDIRQEKPAEVRIDLWAEAPEGTGVLYCYGESAEDYTGKEELPTLPVKIQWGAEGEPPVHTRVRFQDNRDITFLVPELGTLTVEVGFISRNKRFYVVLQEVHAGIPVVSLPADKPADVDGIETDDGQVLWCKPAWPENAYPGADYMKNFPQGKAVLQFCGLHGFYMDAKNAVDIPWNPPPIRSGADKDGLEEAVMLWFNHVVSFGQAQCADGETCFVHFTSIRDREGKRDNRYTFLQARHKIRIRREPSEPGKPDPWRAVQVRPI